jgi:hypothetical protein
MFRTLRTLFMFRTLLIFRTLFMFNAYIRTLFIHCSYIIIQDTAHTLRTLLTHCS